MAVERHLPRANQQVGQAIHRDARWQRIGEILIICNLRRPARMNELLKAVASPADRETLVVEEVTDSADHQHLMVLIVAAVATSLDRPKLCEFLLPITKHVRLDTTKLTHLTNGEVALGWNRWEGVLH